MLLKTPKISINIVFFVLSIILAIFLIYLATIYVKAYLRDDIVIELTGRSDLAFRVFYVENSIFETNPVPSNLHFFMSYTDFIEIDSSFRANFSQEFDVYYEYTATMGLVVRYMSTVDANINPVVLHEVTKFSDVRGNAFTNTINLSADNVESVGRYTIYPRYQIEIYLEIVEDQARQMREQGLLPVGMRGLSAELLVDFTYMVWIPSLDFRQSITQGYRFSLTTEVYGLTLTGTPSFTEIIYITEDLPFDINLLTIIGFVFGIAISSYGIFNGIQHIQADPNEKRQEVKILIRKYGNEIVVSPDQVNLNLYSIVRVEDFAELIKLAINLNKHIRCHQDDNGAMFTVVVDGDVYVYHVKYHLFHENDDKTLETSSIPK